MARPRTHLTAEALKEALNSNKRRYMRTAKFRRTQDRFKKKQGPEYFQDVRLRHKYGISLIERDAMLFNQGGVCAACGSPDAFHKSGWATDHDHRTGRVRGILCQPCNLAAGYVERRPVMLAGLRSYLGFADIAGTGIEHAMLALPA